MGKVTDGGEIDTFLSIQPIREIHLPSGVKKLDRPGINLLSRTGENEIPWAYPTIYWNDHQNKFYSITKADD